MSVVEDINDVIIELVKVIVSIKNSDVDDKMKMLMIMRLLTGIGLLIKDEVYFDTSNPEKTIDNAIKKMEKLLNFVEENRHNPNLRQFMEDIQMIYDELLIDKRRLQIFIKKD